MEEQDFLFCSPTFKKMPCFAFKAFKILDFQTEKLKHSSPDLRSNFFLELFRMDLHCEMKEIRGLNILI